MSSLPWKLERGEACPFRTITPSGTGYLTVEERVRNV